MRPNLFKLTDFLIDKDCHANERLFIACIVQMEAALKFFPGNLVVPPPGDSRYSQGEVVAAFRNARIVDAPFLKTIEAESGEPGLLAEARLRVERWRQEFRKWKSGQPHPVLFYKFANWMATSPYYHASRTQIGAAIFNAKMAIEYDVHSQVAPHKYLRQLLGPVTRAERLPEQEGFVGSARLGEGGKTVLLRLRTFGEPDGQQSPSAELRAELQEHLDAGATSVILDLRGNGGGSVLEASKIANLFVRPAANRFLIRLNYFNGEQAQFPRVVEAPAFPDVPLVVLVDATSVSSFELLAGALQDYGRAIVVGDITHGKGTGQSAEPHPEAPGILFSLTTSLGELPSGTSPYRCGIHPNVRNEDWGVTTAYASIPVREVDLELIDPAYPIPFPQPRSKPATDVAFEDALRRRRAAPANADQNTDPEVRLAVDALSCWGARTRAPVVVPNNG